MHSHTFIHSHTYPYTHPFIHSFIHSHICPYTYLLTHSVTPKDIYHSRPTFMRMEETRDPGEYTKVQGEPAQKHHTDCHYTQD